MALYYVNKNSQANGDHEVHPDLPMPVVYRFLERNEPALAVGMEFGWLGFPRIADGLCFFSGRVSAIVDEAHFLVDGTTIHGVSGGPVFCITENGPRIVGSITTYRPNRVEDGPLPGLSFVTHAAAHRDIDVKATTSSTVSIVNRCRQPIVGAARDLAELVGSVETRPRSSSTRPSLPFSYDTQLRLPTHNIGAQWTGATNANRTSRRSGPLAT